eukprot:1182449-Prorocentrum_minimum.AAC.2
MSNVYANLVCVQISRAGDHPSPGRYRKDLVARPSMQTSEDPLPSKQPHLKARCAIYSFSRCILESLCGSCLLDFEPTLTTYCAQKTCIA